MKTNKNLSFILLIIIALFSSCKHKNAISENFNNINDRVWIGNKYWSIPLEDWSIKNGRVECLSNWSNSRMNLLTIKMGNSGDFDLKLKTGVIEPNQGDGSTGLRIALKDQTDNDYRSVIYHGTGIDIGINTNGSLFIGDTLKQLSDEFEFNDVYLNLISRETEHGHTLCLTVKDNNGNKESLVKKGIQNLSGMIALVTNHSKEMQRCNAPSFWFDDLSINGSMLEFANENTFGPILWTMHTLSKNTLKMSVQMPPIGEKDANDLGFQVSNNNKWQTIATEKIDDQSRVAVFKIPDWNSQKSIQYRIIYENKLKDGTLTTDYYEGTIRKDPVEKNLKMGALTCQYSNGFPYTPIVNNLNNLEPDLLFFSGDQIYEINGGYGTIRFPADRSILNYLGKWYMFGWAFGDLTRSIPTITIPDDHEVYQGNLWGAGGKIVTPEEWAENKDCISGFVQPSEMIDVVMQTNCAQLPDPYDTNKINNIEPYYTDLLYGRVSFAIVADRIFKSGPEQVASWDGRKDHLLKELQDPSVIDNPNLKLLGDRQLRLLSDWSTNWKGTDMKVLLSQTNFTYAATHHGFERQYLAGDLDSGGWPKSGRDRAIKLMRKCFAFHICGDQHLTTFIQYGIDNYRDAGWSFCTPAISVVYPRRFWPDKLDYPVKERPEHDLPNTGLYKDGFGNLNYVYAVGNPDEIDQHDNRYIAEDLKASGFGFITFNKENRTILSESYRFLADLNSPAKENQFPGWPVKIDQIDNYGREAKAWLPTLKLHKYNNPVIAIYDAQTGELVYNLRINEDQFTPKVFKNGTYDIIISNPEKGVLKKYHKIQSLNVNGENHFKVE